MQSSESIKMVSLFFSICLKKCQFNQDYAWETGKRAGAAAKLYFHFLSSLCRQEAMKQQHLEAKTIQIHS